MKGLFWLRSFVAALLPIICLSAYADPPANDSFDQAIQIDAFPYSDQGNLLSATLEPNEPTGQYSATSRTLWWSIKPSKAGILSFGASSVPPYAGWYPWIVVYRGASLESLEYVAESPLTAISISAGEEYRIQLQGIVPGSVLPGDFALGVAFDPQPNNDNFADHIALQGDSAAVRSWIAGATTEPGEPAIGGGGTLWWSWTAPSDGRLQLSQHLDPQTRVVGNVAVYTGASLDQLTRLATNAPCAIKARAGVIYYFQTYPNATNTVETTGFDLNFYVFGPATNDNFADAAPMDGFAKSNAGATREPGEPAHAPGGPNKSIWWKLTAGENRANAAIRISQMTVTNVTIAVYQGATVDTLSLLNKGSDRVFFPMYAGETYYIAAETAAADTGDIALDLFRGYPTTYSRPIPGNLVVNGSFEDYPNPLWVFTDVGGTINEIGPDGRSFVTTYGGNFYQDIPTTAGQKYRLRFVFLPNAVGQPVFTVQFGGVEVGRVVADEGGWQVATIEVTATSALSRLRFEATGGGSMDQISLVSLNDPPAIVTQPASVTAFEGTQALLHAGITGAEPLSRQWLFNDKAIPGATETSLTFAAVSAGDAGAYYVVATNAFGRAESDHVMLYVESVAHLQLVLQPQSDLVFAGQYLALQTAAIGPAPRQFQWFRNGIAIADATNTALTFPSFSSDNAGSYTVSVSTRSESVLSLPAILKLADGAQIGGGLIYFANSWGMLPAVTTAPVYDLDGTIKLNGTNFVAQLYVGTSGDSLRPVGAPAPFGTRGLGVWASQTVTLPNIAPGAEIYVQARVWNILEGASYESARALGGKFGRSEVLKVVAGEMVFPPEIEPGAHLDALQSFSLKAGLPNFVTGNLTLLEVQGDKLIWQLTGAPGFQYLIERQTDGGNWRPFTTVVNGNGSVTFTDTAEATSQIQIYRARMID